MSGHIAVIGAGVGGLAAAVRLAEAGHRVTVHDAAPAGGGLAGGFSVAGTSLERFYHHIFRSDAVAQRWIRDLGLASQLEFLPASMGFYSGGRLHPFGTPLSLLRFAALPMPDRVRLGLRVRRLTRTTSAESFETVTAVDWLRREASAEEMSVFWLPLLRAKFGSDAERISMAWLWARFRARADAASLRRERLGYLRGGFQQLADRMVERAERAGARFVFGSRVLGLAIEAGRVTELRTADQSPVPVDAVVWTPSLGLLSRLAPAIDAAVAERCRAITYHSAVVVVVELRRSALPCYWLTIGDPRLPFTVAVEHTRLVGVQRYDGHTVVYLGRYAAADDSIVAAGEEEIAATFVDAAARALSPEFHQPLRTHVFRAPAAQPIVTPGWATARPPLRGAAAGLVLANMAQIYPWDRGINHSLALGEAAAQAAVAELTVTGGCAGLGLRPGRVASGAE